MPLTNQTLIFLPMLAVGALTFLAIFRMGAGRAAAMRGGFDPRYYRTYQGTAEPAVAIIGVRHYANLMELPTLFYPACLAAFVLGAVGWWTLAFAWGYVACRLVQSAIHLTYNNPAHRGLAFVAGVGFMLALWVNLGLAVCARL